MFLNKMLSQNKKLVEIAFDLHQIGLILPDSYIVDMDTLLENAKKIYKEAKQQNIDTYFMLKQLGRNPVIAKELIKIGYKGCVVVDFKEALTMMKHQIPISNVGHLVQTPKGLLQKIVDYGCEYYTVFSLERIKDLNECAKKSHKKIKLMLKVVGNNDMIYSGQTAGFRLEKLEEIAEEVNEYKNVEIRGVTSFPCFLYDEKEEKICPTPNFQTLMEAKQILENYGIQIDNVNAPSASSVAAIQAMKDYTVNSIEPGHGLTGSTPLHAHRECAEIPAVVYVSEISHNFDDSAYCYGGGHYRRGHVQHAIVGKNLNSCKLLKVLPPSDESIDYYFGLNDICHVNDTVIMAFRFQIFVTRSNVCLVEGIHSNKPTIKGIFTSLGDEIV